MGVIDLDELKRGPEPYLGWYLGGAPNSPQGWPSYICYASEDRGDGHFRAVARSRASFAADRAAQYESASDSAFQLARGLIFLCMWQHGEAHEVTVPHQPATLPSPEIRDALVRALHQLYEGDFRRDDVTVDYGGVALVLDLPESMVRRAATHLLETGLVSQQRRSPTANWQTGKIWLTARGVEYAESIGPAAPRPAPKEDTGGQAAPVQWDVFIAHASEDKAEIAQPMHDMLTKRGFKVWLDSNELMLGDSLRQRIDHGLANSRYGLVILSKPFFAKAWPQRELDGLTALEIQHGKKILPAWHGVDQVYIAQYSPTLADKVAVSTSDGLDRVVDEVARVISS